MGADVTCEPLEVRAERERQIARRRQKAAAAVTKARAMGLLPDPSTLSCFDCGSPAQCYDHRDYRLPLHVWPVCYKCDAARGCGEPCKGFDSYWVARMRKTKRRLCGIAPPFQFSADAVRSESAR